MLAILICTLIGSLTLVAVRFWPATDHSAGKSRTPATTRTLNLAQAMADAAAAVPEIPTDHFDPQAKEYVREGVKRYRVLLAAGEPVVTSDKSLRPFTLAFAAHLSSEAREQWLRACFAQAADYSFDIDAIGRRHNLASISDYISGGHQDICEAVFNLSEDPNLRMDARTRWDEDAHEFYERQLTLWDRGRRDPNVTQNVPRPRLPSIPSWR